MIYLLNFEAAKLFSYITLGVLVAIPIVIFILYQAGAKRDRKRNK